VREHGCVCAVVDAMAVPAIARAQVLKESHSHTDIDRAQ